MIMMMTVMVQCSVVDNFGIPLGWCDNGSDGNRSIAFGVMCARRAECNCSKVHVFRDRVANSFYLQLYIV